MRKRRDNSFDRALVEVLVLGMLVTSGLVAVVVTSPYSSTQMRHCIQPCSHLRTRYDPSHCRQTF